MKLKGVLALALLNVVGFYSLKYYNDTRQVRLVSALLPSVVQVCPIGPQYRYIPVVSEDGIDFKEKRVGFGVTGHGSGVFVSRGGLILTCAHVASNTSLVEIRLNGGSYKLTPKGYKTKGKLLAYAVGCDKKRDVAILRLCKPLKGIRPATIGTSVKKGLPVLTIGFPGPFTKYVTAGIISGSKGTNVYSDLVIAPGNSGGGVFDANGNLVGLASFITGYLPIPVYQGFSGLTSLKAIQEIVNKYRGF